MDASDKEAIKEPAPMSTMPASLPPHALPTALDAFPDVRVLSLDCFDTLLWRDTHAPQDVFAALPATSPLQRIWAETRARQGARIGRGQAEVSIAEIYAQLLPNANAAERDAAIASEIAAEARHCFAFAPTVELMRAARARGLQVIIVSDTYFDARQLRQLIADAAGEEIAGLIDRLFCSSGFGKSKAGGLYADVLRKLKARPEEILHIGDNRKADVDGVAPFGVNTLHLRQFAGLTEQRLRLEASVGAMLHPQESGNAATPQLHRAGIAAAEASIADPSEAFGFAVLGPVMSGFERWLQAEARALRKARGGTVHWLFLMRDGWLPMRVHAAACPDDPGHAVEISRFTSIAASFRSEADVQRHVEMELGLNPPTLARQVLLPEADITRLVGDLSLQDGSLALLREMRKGDRKRQTLRASRAMADRLIAHVRQTVDPAEGDTLMLVDLGYNGTVQNQIDAVLAKALKVHVAGRYLLLRETDRPGLDKRGFIGADHYDAFTLEAFCTNVAVLEQLCTRHSGSVIDYTPTGEPIRRDNDIKQRQSATREQIQTGCVRFMAESAKPIVRAMPGDQAPEQSGDGWRMGAASALARLMFLPLEEELAILERFEHDVNLGTDRTVALFDRAVARRGLRERGLFYMKGADRMYLPAELHGQGMAPKLALFAHKRFGLPMNHADFADASIDVPVIFAAGEDLSPRPVTATATHDGYYMAAIPIGDCRYSVALQFGQAFGWLQVESAGFLAVDDFMSESHQAARRVTPAEPICDGMESVAPGLYRCADESGFMMIHPPRREDETPMMLSVVFRPIAPRADDAASQAMTQGAVARPMANTGLTVGAA